MSSSFPPPFGDTDIPALFADVGIPITVGGAAGLGIPDPVDELLVKDGERGVIVVPTTTITVQTSAFPAAAIGQAVVIGSTNFTVRERLRVGDGALTKLILGGGPVAPSVGEAAANIIDGGTF